MNNLLTIFGQIPQKDTLRNKIENIQYTLFIQRNVQISFLRTKYKVYPGSETKNF